jgi:hypothetical protein
MKRLLLTAAAVLAAVNIYAQGTVNPNTFNHSQLLNEDNGNAAIGLADGIQYQVYWSPVGAGTFSAAGSPLPMGTIPGYSIGQATVELTGLTAGGMADVQLRAWESAYGASYEEASGAPEMGGRKALIGTSATITVKTGGDGVPPALPPTLTVGEWTVSSVPEPSVIALGLVGAGALLVLRRRNK